MIELDIVKSLKGSEKDMKLSCNLKIDDGEFVALGGRSGSGKTTLLRILAGLEDALGSIVVDGRSWLDNRSFMPPQKREIGFVFQDYALFSNMSVRENLLYVNRDESLLKRLLDITQLSGMEDRSTDTLSGGQKQRVALCRAFMAKPKLLLMDEPLSALEHDLRVKLQNEIKILHDEFKTTTIMVSHDSSEIYRLADRVVVLDNGEVIKNETTKDIIYKSKISDEFIVMAEVLEISKDYENYVATLLVCKSIVNVTISKEESKTLYVGKQINIKSSSLSLKS